MDRGGALVRDMGRAAAEARGAAAGGSAGGGSTRLVEAQHH